MTADLSLIARCAARRVAVAGDVMLDHFVIGRVDRISPEAPVPVVCFEREEYRLGGAANVAHNVASLQGIASVIGVIGDDDAGRTLRQHLSSVNLDHTGLVIDRERPTTLKTRIVTTRNQQVARVDRERDAEVSGNALAALIDQLTRTAATVDALILSDYRKGVISAALIAAAVAAAQSRKIPVLVDPKRAHAERYRGTSLITPNHHEAELMTRMSIRTTDDARSAARLLHDQTGANVLMTWGEHGMWVFDASGATAIERALPAVAREVADVTGAGDTVIAVLGLALAAGAPLVEAADLANIAAGLVVARFGPACVTPDELASAAAAAH
jgi:rfaE bifunctional protein kinase chain/domain